MPLIDPQPSGNNLTSGKLTVLHTEWSDGWGGQERRILSEMIGMRKRGYRQLLACRSSCKIGTEAKSAGISTFHQPFAGKFDVASIRNLIRLIHDEGVDLVNTHSGIDSWVGGIAARLAGVLLVRTRHLNLPLKRNLLNFVHYLPHAVVTCGEEMRRILINRGFPPNEVHSIPTGIDFGAFKPKIQRADMRMTLKLQPDTFTVIMVGIIRGVKRHEIALRAFAELHRKHPNSSLLLAGEGPMRVDMERLAAELQLGENIHFLGQRDDVPDLLQAADCLLLTSRSEGVPQAVTQAMGCGLPVVATAVGGVPELVIDGETGLLVPPESVELTALALQRLADNSKLACELALSGKQHAERLYSIDAMLGATESLYRQLQVDTR